MTDSEQAAALARALPYGGAPLDGVATAGQMSEAQVDQLAKAGYRVIVDLRAPQEQRGYDERAAVERAGMEYVTLPVTPETLVDATFDRVRELLKDREKRPIVVHCQSANRVGGVMLPFLVLDEGRTPEDALALAGEIGLRNPDYARMAIDYVRRHAAG
ncbi:MAG: protein tyrosine phosphatase family protein [Gemmatimonadota bacterium]|nr:protein tyrosine phosphatase family protein [Gemmatimonadota bacterium]